MSLHISTQELDEQNLSYEEFFRVIHVILKHETMYLRQLHPSKSINDIESYPIIIIEKVLKITSTLYTVVNANKDYIVSNIIIRSLADVISSLILIYSKSNDDLKLLRHYLFIMDGLQGRINNLPSDLKYDGKIKKEEFEALSQQIESARDNYKGAYSCAEEEIKKLSIYESKKNIIDHLISKRNWRFKELSESPGTHKWTELYTYAELPLDSEFFSLLSEYVHGLSTSNLIVDSDNETFEPILSIASSLMGKVHEFIHHIYADDIPLIKESMISALYDDNLPLHYVESIASEYIKTIND